VYQPQPPNCSVCTSPFRLEDICVELLLAHTKLADDTRRGRLGEVVFGESFLDHGAEFLEDQVHIVVNRFMVWDYKSDSVEQHLFTDKKE
jgi:hypothetical protein